MYHIFTNNQDEWLESERQALLLARQWYKEYGTARVYNCIYNDIDDTWDDEDVIYSRGEFPC